MGVDLALFSAKGSPGTTTLAEALVTFASRLGPALLVEFDPDGGDRAASPASLSIRASPPWPPAPGTRPSAPTT